MTTIPAPGATTAGPGTGCLEVLHARRIEYALLRPARCADDDLDVLVAPDDLEPSLRLLRSNGFVEEPAYGRGSHRFLVRLEGDRFVRLDLVTSLDFGPLSAWPSGMAPACLARSRGAVDGTSRLDPRDEFWVTLLHLVADGGRGQQDLRRLDQLIALAPDAAAASLEDWHRVVSPLLPRSFAPADLARICADGDAKTVADALRTLRPAVRRRCLREVLATGAAPGLLAASTLRATEKVRQWHGRRGLLVAVLGPDGAGKSTLLEAVGAAWLWPHQRVYFGLWPDAHDSSRMARTLWPLRRPLRAVRRYAIGWFGGVRGRLVLFDRYVYDAAPPPRGRLLGLKHVYFGILLRCVPAPDVAVLLDAPGEVLYARKGELSPQVLDENRNAIARHVHEVHRRSGHPHVVTIDATQHPSVVAEQAIAVLWQLAAVRLQGRERGVGA